MNVFGDVTILVGDNAQGKTNILESIFLAASGSSFRNSLEQFLIKNGAEDAHVFVETQSDDGTPHIFRVVWQKDGLNFKKTLQADGVKVTRADLLQKLPAVIFSPEDIDLLRLSPSHRRRWLDLLIGRHDAAYRADLNEYTQIRRQRNQLLLLVKQRRVEAEELDVWDERLAKVGARLVAKRAQAIKDIASSVQAKYALIAQKHEAATLSVKYAPSLNFDYERDYLAELVRNRLLDIARATTTAGVHRDDLLFILNNQDVRYTASRGEFRSVVLALKLVEAQYLKTKLSESPVFLLDDAFSELDDNRRQALVSEVSGYQTLITTNNIYLKELFAGAQEYTIEQGRVMVYT